VGLWVPSVVEPQECNLLINPAHPQYAAIAVVTEIIDFEFDPRLF
jgi:RES domain-containing protein